MFLDQANTRKLLRAIYQLKPSDQEVILLLIGEHVSLDFPLLINELNTKKIHFFGGIFPAVIYKQDKFENGIIIKKFPMHSPPLLIKIAAIKSLNLSPLKIPGRKKYTTFTFVDGLSKQIPELLHQLYNQIGDRVNYIGGGAGSLTLEKKPCILSKEGLQKDVAVICHCKLSSKLSVKHGWEKLIGPLVATRAEGNVIKELNWQPAFKVYADILKKEVQKNITKKDFFKIAKFHPFGMYKEDSEMIVRDPISCNSSGAITCIGEVPENSVINILQGNKDRLIEAASNAGSAIKLRSNQPLKHNFIIDCISRVLFLEERFTEELSAINLQLKDVQDEKTLQGALTLGEIANSGDGWIEFYNKTLVVSSMY